jgi:hypothetical protein
MSDESTYGFSRADADSLITVIGSRNDEHTDFTRRGGDAAIRMAYPPTGGLPAATWSATTLKLTPGQASCFFGTKVNGQYEKSTTSVMVENPVGVVVGSNGKPIVIGKNTSGNWTVLVEDCSGTTTTTTTGGSTGTGSGIGGTGTGI